MTSGRLALVAEDQRLAGGIQAFLQGELPHRVLVETYQGIRHHLARDSDVLLLLLASSRAESELMLRLIQEIYLQKFPPILMVLATAGQAGDERLGQLDPYVARRLRWPEDRQMLLHLTRERVGRLRGLPVGGNDLEDQVCRRLQALTPSLAPLAERIALAAAHDVTVLLTGETGTGKTYLARLMHQHSPRHGGPFLVVPCGAQTPSLLESTFFGHVRGAFTGADRDKEGKFEAAGSGFLLLDEIDTLPLQQQAGLLRVIETGEFEPVGSNETRHCHARIIVASNWDLEKAVREGKFREDLYYRLNVMSFHLPALRERVHDIGPLTRAFVAGFNTRFRKDLFDINPLTLEALETFPWPGNIRQLENFLQQAVLISKGNELLLEHLPEQVRQHFAGARDPGAAPPPDTLSYTREMTERSVIQRALIENGYSRSRAATSLGISRVTLYKKMKKYGLMGMPITPSSS